jgi:hypothetical protein
MPESDLALLCERVRLSHLMTNVESGATCPGSLVVHADGTIAGCTPDRLRVQGFIAALRRVLVMVSSSRAFVGVFR